MIQKNEQDEESIFCILLIEYFSIFTETPLLKGHNFQKNCQIDWTKTKMHAADERMRKEDKHSDVKFEVDWPKLMFRSRYMRTRHLLTLLLKKSFFCQSIENCSKNK